jgi:hypothetical protein
MRSDDVPAVTRLAQETCARFGDVAQWIPEWWSDGPARASVADVDGKIVGFSICMPCDPDPWWECRLAAVALAYRRRALARAIFQADIVAAREQRRTELLLSVASDNAAMLSLADSLCYRRVKTLARLTYPDGTPAIILRRRP